MERRILAVADLKLAVRAAGEGKSRTVRGYAAVFNTLSVSMWGFRKKIAPGAFADSLANEDDVRALWNHDTNWPIGRKKAGTLRLAEDETGLAVEIDLPASQAGDNFLAMIERGDVDQMSFGFRTVEDRWDIDAEEQVIRTLQQVKLYEVSPVTFPAYPDTSIGMRERPDAGLAGVRFDPVFGEIPVIPLALQQELQGGAAEAEAAQVRRVRRLRELDLLEQV